MSGNGFAPNHLKEMMYMARAIVRYSFDGVSQNVRNHIRGYLGDAGFRSTGTGTWEADGQPAGLMEALRNVMRLIEREADGRLDHLWIYVDEPSA